jgi:hypothetical protein
VTCNLPILKFAPNLDSFVIDRLRVEVMCSAASTEDDIWELQQDSTCGGVGMQRIRGSGLIARNNVLVDSWTQVKLFLRLLGVIVGAAIMVSIFGLLKNASSCGHSAINHAIPHPLWYSLFEAGLCFGSGVALVIILLHNNFMNDDMRFSLSQSASIVLVHVVLQITGHYYYLIMKIEPEKIVLPRVASTMMLVAVYGIILAFRLLGLEGQPLVPLQFQRHPRSYRICSNPQREMVFAHESMHFCLKREEGCSTFLTHRCMFVHTDHWSMVVRIFF